MSYTAQQYFIWTTWNICFRIYLFIAPIRSQKTTIIFFTFVTGVELTSWCLLRPWFNLRFIWPCKSDCQPISPKIQRTYSLFVKLWFVRPLIFKIRDSSPQYLSNVTFGTSFAFQIRKEYVFEKNIFWKSDLKGGNLHMFLEISQLTIETKKSLERNYFDNLVLEFF